MPPEESCPPVKIGVWVKVSVSFRIGRQPGYWPEENCPLVRVRGSVRLSFGVWVAIFRGGNSSRTVWNQSVILLIYQKDYLADYLRYEISRCCAYLIQYSVLGIICWKYQNQPISEHLKLEIITKWKLVNVHKTQQ